MLDGDLGLVLWSGKFIKDWIWRLVIQEQNKRAVESMCRCGFDLEDVLKVFPREEIATIYKAVRDRGMDADVESGISMNCS